MTNQWQGQGYTYIAGSTTTTIATGPGFLHSVSISVPTGAVVLYDSLTGSGTTIGSFVANTVSANFVVDTTFSVGLTAVTTNAPQATITWHKVG